MYNFRTLAKKIRMKNFLFFFVSLLFLSSIDGFAQKLANPNIRFYNDVTYTYEFEIDSENKKVKPRKEVEYFWYSSGVVGSTYADFTGRLLNGTYEMLHNDSQQLVRKGAFKYGIKTGEWRYWFLNGNLDKIESWKKGLLHGKFEKYDQNGNLLIEGKYKYGFKHGIWIDYTKKKRTRYDKGKKVPLKKTPFWKNLFAKKKDA